MRADSLNQFTDALKQCASCSSQCTATLPATELTHVVTEVVSELAPVHWSEATLPLEPPPETILLILTYSYACGVFGSQEIAEELADRADRCALVRQLAIDASILTGFRRENRELLRRCLAAVLRRSKVASPAGAWLRGGVSSGTPGLEKLLGPAPDPEREADRRIVLAAQTDSEARDG